LYLRMTRIFLTLASLSVILLVTAMVMGLAMGDLYERPVPSHETLHWATLHRLTGVAAALAVVFVESVVVTYFIGTSRWCKEVVETYQLDRAPVVASSRLKRRTFPWALAGMLGVVAIIALGGAADPASLQPNTKAWANWHLIGAFSGIGLVAWTYLVAWNNILANHAIITGLVAKVARLRQDRGMDVEAESGPFFAGSQGGEQSLKR
jgi:amino acid transporter